MRIVPLVAALTLAFATPAFAQPQGQGQEKAQEQKAKKANKSKDQAKAKERSNKGGATRGEERAGEVKDMNNQRKTN